MRLLMYGSTGIGVLRVQQALNRRMLFPNNQISSPRLQRLAEDAIFGARTKAMVIEFQRINRVKPDGIVGPITGFLLFPYIDFRADLEGEGRIRGRPGEAPVSRRLLATPRTSGSKAKEPAVGDPDGKDEEGLTLEVSASQGFKHEFKPWFVLKPDEPEGPKSSATLSVEAVILRKAGFEFSGELEFSRRVPVTAGSTWIWEGAVKGTYTDLPKVGGGILTPLSPSASLKLGQGGALGAGVGVEASVRLIKDTLELSVGGEVATQLNPHDGNFEVGGEISGALKLNLDVIRRLGKR